MLHAGEMDKQRVEDMVVNGMCWVVAIIDWLLQLVVCVVQTFCDRNLVCGDAAGSCVGSKQAWCLWIAGACEACALNVYCISCTSSCDAHTLASGSSGVCKGPHSGCGLSLRCYDSLSVCDVALVSQKLCSMSVGMQLPVTVVFGSTVLPVSDILPGV